MLEIRCLLHYPVFVFGEFSSFFFYSMALIRSASSLSATLSTQVPRALPVVFHHASGVLSYNNNNSVSIQKRTFLVGAIINLSFGEGLACFSCVDAVFLTTAASAMRRVSGIEYVEKESYEM